MTVRINKKALNLREELTKAQGVVRYEQRQFWKGNFVDNGTFDTDTAWTKGSGVTISSGVANATSASVIVRQDMGLETGKNYAVTFDYTKTSGDALKVEDYPALDDLAVTSTLGSSGSVTLNFTATTSEIAISAHVSFFTGTIDNVQVFEVDENNNVIHSVPLGFKPVHVYEDGLLQREGANHDYTVIDTGFGYQVKPTVAPSATTETCIIAEREL